MAAAQCDSSSLLNTRLLTTLAPKHFTNSQRQSSKGIFASLWKGPSKTESEREKPKPWQILFLISGGQFVQLVFPCISHCLCSVYSSPASCHSMECRSTLSSCKRFSTNRDFIAQVLATCTNFGLSHFPSVQSELCGSEGYKLVCQAFLP